MSPLRTPPAQQHNTKKRQVKSIPAGSQFSESTCRTLKYSPREIVTEGLLISVLANYEIRSQFFYFRRFKMQFFEQYLIGVLA